MDAPCAAVKSATMRRKTARQRECGKERRADGCRGSVSPCLSFLLCKAGDINPKTLALPLIVLPLSLAVASSCFSQPVEGVLHGALTNLGVEPSRRGQTKKMATGSYFHRP